MSELADVSVYFAAGFLMAVLIEQWPWFGEIKPKTKRLVVAVLAGLIGVAIAVVIGVVEPPFPEWNALVGVFFASLISGFTGSQAAHTAFYLK